MFGDRVATEIGCPLPQYAQRLFVPKRYKIFWGGRGAARSWSYARALLVMGAQRRMRILCCREFQKSLEDSVHKLLQDQIELLKLPGWKILKSTIEHVGTGTTFSFEGLRYNTSRIKSFEGVDVCWVEEAESVSDESWMILIPTIRKIGSEIWISFNPYLETDATYQRFVIHKPDNAFVEKVGWEDNPWFPQELRDEKDYLYRIDRAQAEHVWGGTPWRSAESQILNGKWVVEPFAIERRWKGPFYGLDFGFADDPTALTESYVAHQPGKARVMQNAKLYVHRESWNLKLDNHKMLEKWLPIFGKGLIHRVIRADSSRPETISYLKKRRGFHRMLGAPKWPGSVEDGIAFLRSFQQIIIHPSCKHARLEAIAYSYKTDKNTGEVLPAVVDKHNNIWDAERYALVRMIRARKGRRTGGYAGTTYLNN